MNAKQAQQAKARETLLAEFLSLGDTVHMIVCHVARSGMSRHISTLIVKNGQIRDITYLVAEALDYRRDIHDGGLVVTGCGMDMGFEVVYNLGRALWPQGYAQHTDGGYALRQDWI